MGCSIHDVSRFIYRRALIHFIHYSISTGCFCGFTQWSHCVHVISETTTIGEEEGEIDSRH